MFCALKWSSLYLVTTWLLLNRGGFQLVTVVWKNSLMVYHPLLRDICTILIYFLKIFLCVVWLQIGVDILTLPWKWRISFKCALMEDQLCSCCGFCLSVAEGAARTLDAVVPNNTIFMLSAPSVTGSFFWECVGQERAWILSSSFCLITCASHMLKEDWESHHYPNLWPWDRKQMEDNNQIKQSWRWKGSRICSSTDDKG